MDKEKVRWEIDNIVSLVFWLNITIALIKLIVKDLI